MTRHTPGPWGFIGTKGFGYAVHHSGTEGHVIADIISIEANARLIAQSPEMYRRLTEAAQFLNGEYPNSKENRDYLKISIKAVLAKVEGGE